MHSHHIQQIGRQPVWLVILLVVSYTGKMNFPRVRGYGLARRVRPCCPASARSFSTSRLDLVLLTDSLSFSRFPRWCPSIPSTAIGSVPSLSGHVITYRWRLPPRVHLHKGSSRVLLMPIIIQETPWIKIDVRLFFFTTIVLQ